LEVCEAFKRAGHLLRHSAPLEHEPKRVHSAIVRADMNLAVAPHRFNVHFDRTISGDAATSDILIDITPGSENIASKTG